MALIAASVRGSNDSMQGRMKRAVVNAAEMNEDVKESDLAIGFGLFVALAMYLTSS
jgi:hypothetical protein